MKPIRQQFKEAFAWKSRLSPRDFILMVIAGLAITYGVVFWISGDSAHSPLDIKVAIRCVLVVGLCVLLTSNRLLVLSGGVMTPAVLVWFDAVVKGNQKVLEFCFVDVAFGFLILVVGTLARSLWHGRSSTRGIK
jgi:hypothetical protein